MIHRIVQASLRQRFLVLMLTGFIMVAGIISFQRMPVDAYPDLSPPQVELITAMARPRRGRSGTPRHSSSRTADDRCAAHGGDAVHLAVWSVGCQDDI